MRVLILTHNYPRFAGDSPATGIARLARDVADAGHEVSVVAPHAAGLAAWEEADGLNVLRFRYAPEWLERIGYDQPLDRDALRSPAIALGMPGFLWAFERAAQRELRDFAPDVVHAHWSVPAGWVASRLGRPYVLTSYGSDARLLREVAAARRFARPAFARARALTAVSRFAAEDVARAVGPFVRQPIEPMRLPLDVASFSHGSAVRKVDPPRILYAGSLTASKGVDVLLDAVALLRQRDVACQLKILGEGPEAGRLEERALQLGLRDALWWPFVPQPEMPAEYGRATVTVLPARGQREALALPLAEALLGGSAVVATASGAVPEIVRHEQTGLIARDGDATDLAAQIARLLQDEALRARLVRSGRQHVCTSFAPGAAVERYLALYESLSQAARAA